MMKSNTPKAKFHVRECRFDPLKDIAEVSQNGSIDLKAAYKSGIIPADNSDVDDNFNSIESSEDCLGKPHDQFEYMRMTQHIKDTLNAPTTTEVSAKTEDQS